MLFSPLTRLEFEVDAILRKRLDKQLYQPKRDDSLRLQRLKVWSMRYSVSLEYILTKLIPHFEKLAQRHYIRRSAGQSKGIGVSIAVLTGPAAEEKLKEFIQKDFPSNENVAIWRENEQERCLAILDEIEYGRPKPILHFKSVSDFVKAYSNGIDRKRRKGRKLDNKLGKQPWRGNPWK